MLTRTSASSSFNWGRTDRRPHEAGSAADPLDPICTPCPFSSCCSEQSPEKKVSGTRLPRFQTPSLDAQSSTATRKTQPLTPAAAISRAAEDIVKGGRCLVAVHRSAHERQD